MALNNSMDEFDYDYEDPRESVNIDEEKAARTALMKYMYVIVYSLVILLGLPLHTFVIYRIGKMPKTAVSILFLGLSVTDLVVILSLPLHIISAWEGFTWQLPGALCTACSYVMFLNMHATALLLASLSVVRSCRAFHRCWTPMVSQIVVAVAAIAAAFLSFSTLLYRRAKSTPRGTVCSDAYPDRAREVAVAVFRFLAAWLCPCCVAFVSSCLVSLTKNVNRIKGTKGYAITRIMMVAYFLCWLPYHLFMLIRLHPTDDLPENILPVALPVSTALSFLNSCMNPIIYMFKGGIKMSWLQNAFQNEEADREATSEQKEKLTLHDTSR
ncbi:chemerin-like receptor 1 [Conger conger]|uniref:chemerin-like receptor 1 n=1 Tax=Conger conger TaxID=82655 RepID=UPI002A5A94E7|nr:chemerin-like receptor 1 [Conger conger]